MSLCGTDDERRTSEDRATQPMEAGKDLNISPGGPNIILRLEGGI